MDDANTGLESRPQSIRDSLWQPGAAMILAVYTKIVTSSLHGSLTYHFFSLRHLLLVWQQPRLLTVPSALLLVAPLPDSINQEQFTFKLHVSTAGVPKKYRG